MNWLNYRQKYGSADTIVYCYFICGISAKGMAGEQTTAFKENERCV